MDEVLGRDGAWTFDLETIRIVPAHGRGVHKLRQAIGELPVPLEAVAGIAYEPGRKGGRLRLRLRVAADPFTQVTAGRLPDAADPYQLAIESGQSAAAEYLVDAVRNAMLVRQVPEGPTDRYLMPGPGVPQTATAGDGTATFDGERIRLDWNGWAQQSKRSAGSTQLQLGDLTGVEWNRTVGFNPGYLRFLVKGAASQPPAHDPNCLAWGVQELGGTTTLLAAAVVVRLPHPSAAPAAADPEAGAGARTAGDPDALLRRLRELGELHREGVLSDEEFTAAKQALLRDA